MTFVKYIFFIALLWWGNSVIGQTENPYKKIQCFFYLNEDNTFFKTVNNEKILDFEIIGLNNTDQCSYFSSSFIVRKGAYEVTVSDSLPNGKRTVHCRFHKGYSTYNLVKVLYSFFEIPFVFVNNDQIPTISLEKEYGNE